MQRPRWMAATRQGARSAVAGKGWEASEGLGIVQTYGK